MVAPSDMQAVERRRGVERKHEAKEFEENAETDAVSILYRRKDGNLGLIEPD